MIDLLQGDCIEVMRTLPECSIDAVVTDPPYELGFMGKSWDKSGIAYSIELWRGVLRVLKPGGHMLAFGGTRTYHRMACAIEDAGFEIRDQLQWLYGSGFPKSLNISKAIDKAAGAKREIIGKSNSKGIKSGSGNYVGDDYKCDGYNITIPATQEAKQWQGWGTALKPSNEPICLARKPLSEKTVAANVLRWGTGGINVEGCRIGTETIKTCGGNKIGNVYNKFPECQESYHAGRFPANILLDETAAALLDEQSGKSRSVKRNPTGKLQFPGTNSMTKSSTIDSTIRGHSDSGGASRFFYVAKASARERGAGNNHPTVKPIRLMRYLCRLITPPGGTVLDPFAGSGTTLLAGLMENFRAMGIEKEREYCDIIHKRITKYKERNSGSDEFPLCWTSLSEEDIAFLAELNNRE